MHSFIHALLQSCTVQYFHSGERSTRFLFKTKYFLSTIVPFSLTHCISEWLLPLIESLFRKILETSLSANIVQGTPNLGRGGGGGGPAILSE